MQEVSEKFILPCPLQGFVEINKLCIFQVIALVTVCITMKSSMYVMQFRAILQFYPEIALHPS